MIPLKNETLPLDDRWAQSGQLRSPSLVFLLQVIDLVGLYLLGVLVSVETAERERKGEFLADLGFLV